MSLKKVRKKIDKIQRTVELLDGDLGAIERDLLLAYIRDLYDEVLRSSSGQATTVRKPALKQEVESDPPAVEVETRADEPEASETTAPDVKEEPAAVIDSAEEDEELLELFEIKEAEDLGDKLSLLPIKDLTKAMSINERIFTINELFGGDHGLFTATLEDLNGLANYDEAVKYLVNGVARDHDWQDPQHTKKAEKFIQLVQRRFRQ